MKSLRLLSVLLIPLILCSCQSTKFQPVTSHNRYNTPETVAKPYVVLVSIDGFRADYVEKYDASNIAAIGNEGVKADYMIPSFPSLTFPNHYTLVTGMYPTTHGLVSNSFIDGELGGKYRIGDPTKVLDGEWYGGTPLWVLAENQGMRATSFFWVGSEADIQGVRPYQYYEYNKAITHKDRVNQVIKWLKLPDQERPHLITVYFSDVDSKGHKYGPDSPEVAASVADVDFWIGELQKKLEKLDLPIHLIVTSDHGMQQTNTAEPIYFNTLTNLSYYDIARSAGVLYYLYPKEGVTQARLDSTFQELTANAKGRYQVFWSDSLPDRLHFAPNKRTGKITVFANAPYIFGTQGRSVMEGTHGYDPRQSQDMLTIFYAKGPRFKIGSRLSSMHNVHVFPLVAELLGLTYDKDAIDGDFSYWEKVLK